MSHLRRVLKNVAQMQFLKNSEPLKTCQIFMNKMAKLKPFIVITLLILPALACNALTSNPTISPTYVIVEPTFPPTQSNLPSTDADVPRVSLEEALVAHDSGAAVFVDVRSRQAFDAGHIPGATNIPLSEFETNLAAIQLPKDQWIITYCT
jgi:hypothetical protein